MPVKWIICDIDGCISPEESVAWDVARFAEFAQLVQDANAGRTALAPMTLCTGRPQPYVEVLMKLLDIRAPAICENGAVLYSLHNNHARFGPAITEEKLLSLRALRAFIETDLLPKYDDVVLQFGKEAQLSVFSEKPAVFHKLTKAIDAFLAQHPGPEFQITVSHFYLNISLAGVDKGAALRVLLDELGVSGSETAGIGDTEGDLPLREVVGFFACPANAKPVIKDCADYISPYKDLVGVLDILQRCEVNGC